MTVKHLPLKLINILKDYQLNTFLRIVFKLKVNCSVTFKSSSFLAFDKKSLIFICSFGRKLFLKKISGSQVLFLSQHYQNEQSETRFRGFGSDSTICSLALLKNLIQTP